MCAYICMCIEKLKANKSIYPVHQSSADEVISRGQPEVRYYVMEMSIFREARRGKVLSCPVSHCIYKYTYLYTSSSFFPFYFLLFFFFIFYFSNFFFFIYLNFLFIYPTIYVCILSVILFSICKIYIHLIFIIIFLYLLFCFFFFYSFRWERKMKNNAWAFTSLPLPIDTHTVIHESTRPCERGSCTYTYQCGEQYTRVSLLVHMCGRNNIVCRCKRPADHICLCCARVRGRSGEKIK